MVTHLVAASWQPLPLSSSSIQMSAQEAGWWVVTPAGYRYPGNEAKKAAQESVVMLANKGGTLPLDRNNIKKLLVLGTLSVALSSRAF